MSTPLDDALCPGWRAQHVSGFPGDACIHARWHHRPGLPPTCGAASDVCASRRRWRGRFALWLSDCSLLAGILVLPVHMIELLALARAVKNVYSKVISDLVSSDRIPDDVSSHG